MFRSIGAILTFSTFAVHSEAATIGFDVALDGGAIRANPTFSETSADDPEIGPLVSAYGLVGTIFDGGVVLSYDAFGGPTDSRDDNGRVLETSPNLLATSDFLPLSDGNSLDGTLTANFSIPVGVVRTSIRNGFGSANFAMSAYYEGALVDFQTIELGNFLSDDQDGSIAVTARKIDEVRIVSDQPTGAKNFGIDGFDFQPSERSDELHSSILLADAQARGPNSQILARENFEAALDEVYGLENDGNFTGLEAVLNTYFFVDEIVTAVQVLKGTFRSPFLPFLIVPCFPGDEVWNPSCSDPKHTQVVASLFDVSEFSLAVRNEALSAPLLPGESFSEIVALEIEGFPTVASLEISYLNEDVFLLGVRSITDVSSATPPLPSPVPLPSTLPLLLLALVGLARNIVGSVVLWLRQGVICLRIHN